MPSYYSSLINHPRSDRQSQGKNSHAPLPKYITSPTIMARDPFTYWYLVLMSSKKPDTTSTKFKHLPRDHSFPSIIWLTILPPKLETINENWILIQFSTSNKETCGFAQKNQWMHQWELLLLVHQHRYNPITLLKLVTRRSVNTVTWSKCYQTPVVKFGHSTPTQQFVRTKTINPYRLTIKDTGNTILIGSGGFKGLIWNSQEKLENKPKKVE